MELFNIFKRSAPELEKADTTEVGSLIFGKQKNKQFEFQKKRFFDEEYNDCR